MWRKSLPKRIYYTFNLTHNHTSPHFQRIMWLYRWVSLTTSHQSAKFSSYRPCGRRDILFLICHLTYLCQHCQRVMWYFVWVPLVISHYHTWFDGRKRCTREDILFLVCHVTTREYLLWELRNIMGEFPSWEVTTLQSLMIINLLEEEIWSFQFATWSHVITRSEDHVTWGVDFRHHKPRVVV